jgi:hypothetical protein
MQTADRGDAAVSTAPRIFMLIGVFVRWGEVLAIDTDFHWNFPFKRTVGNFPR